MKKILTFCCCWVIITGLHALPVQNLKGVLPLNNTNGNIYAIAYHEGILFFANQVGIEMYLYNQVIGNFPYAKLTGADQITRMDKIYLLPDSATNTLIIWDSKENIGILDYKKGHCRIISDIQEKKEKIALAKREWSRRQPQMPANLVNTIAVKNEWLSREKNWPVWLIGDRFNGLQEYEPEPSGYTYKPVRQLVFRASSGNRVDQILSLAYLPDFDAVVIGTCGDGAYLWSQQRDQVFTPVFDPDPEHDGQQQHYWSFTRLDDKRFLAGNDLGSVQCFDLNGNCLQTIMLHPNRHEQVLCIAPKPGSSRHFLAGTNAGSLYLLDFSGKSGRCSLLHTIDARIYAMLADTSAGTVWIGTDNKGVLKYDVASRQISDEADEFYSAKFFARHPEGVIGGGTEGRLFCLLPDGRINMIDNDLPKDDLCNVLFLSDGHAMIFTRNNFVHYGAFDFKGNRFIRQYTFNESNGLVFRDRLNGNQVYPISTLYGGFEVDGNVWCSSNFGILRIAPQDTTAVVNFYYRNATGLPGLEYNTNAFLQMNDSVLVFGARRGLLLVNVRAADRLYHSRQLNAVQLWKIAGETAPDNYRLRFVEQQFEQVQKCTDWQWMGFSERNVQYLPVVADYSLLETPQLEVSNSSNKTFIIASGRAFPASLLWGDFTHGPRLIEFSLRHIRGKTGVFFQKTVQKSSPLFVIICSFLVAGMALGFSWRKERMRQRDAANRRKTFIDLGKALAAARRYEDLHTALNTVFANAKSVLGDSRMSIYVYEENAKILRTVAFAGTYETQPDFITVSNRGVYYLDKEEDAHRPIIAQWKNGNAEQPLVINRASSEFYRGKPRPRPKITHMSESFIFKTLNIGDKPVAILSIQNEKENAYAGRHGEEMLQHLDSIAYFLGLSLDIIHRNRTEALESLTLQYFNDIAHLRLSQHITKNFVERIGELYPEAQDITNSFTGFLGRVYTARPVIYANEELRLIQYYYRDVCQFMYGKTFHISIENQNLISLYKIPAFILLNAVNNSMKHGGKDFLNIEIRGEMDSEAKEIVLKVTDDGAGINFEHLRKRQAEGSSTQLIERYFTEICEKTGIPIPMPELKNTGPDGHSCAQVCYRLPFAFLDLTEQ